MIRDVQFAADMAGVRLDVCVLGKCPSSTRGLVRAAIGDGRILLRGKKALKGDKVREGDVVSIVELEEAFDLRVRPDPSIVPSIVYDDGVLIGVDKPPGMPVQPLSPRQARTLVSGLVAYAPEIAAVGDDPLMAGALHRIDTWTSGLVLASRSEGLWREMRGLFASRRVVKTYLALVEGRVRDKGKIACNLAHDPRSEACHMVESNAPDAMFAETSYKPVRFANGQTLLEVTILTGVTHQIRAQLSIAGFPIVGDALYGSRTPSARRQMLHSLAVSFPYPGTGANTHIATSPPDWAR